MKDAGRIVNSREPNYVQFEVQRVCEETVNKCGISEVEHARIRAALPMVIWVDPCERSPNPGCDHVTMVVAPDSASEARDEFEWSSTHRYHVCMEMGRFIE